MPKTCREETIPDTAIIHPVFASRLTSISVLKRRLAGLILMTRSLNFTCLVSRSFVWTTNFRANLASPEQDLDAVAPEAIDKVGEITTLTDWAYPVETYKALAVRKEYPKSPETFPLKSLPKTFRGRCKPQVPKKRPGPGMVHCLERTF